jgi:outer membrane protein assembly factor BamB
VAISPATVGSLDVGWEATVDDAAVTNPVVSAAGVHVLGDSALYGFNAGTGARLWKFEMGQGAPPSFVRGSVIFDGDVLIVGYGRGGFAGSWTTARLDPATGVVAGPVVGAGLVDGVRGSTYVLRSFSSGSGTPVAMTLGVIDRVDAGRGWSGITDYATGGDGGSPVTLGTDRVVQAGQGFLLGGATPVRGNGLRSYPLVAPPACPAPGEVFTCPTWTRALDGTTSTPPVLDGTETTLFSGTDAGSVYGVNAVDGTVKWVQSVGAGVTDSPALANGALYVPTASGDLVVLDAATGARRWTGSTGSRIGVQPAVAGGVVFTGSDDGTVQAFDAAGCGSPTCSRLWSASTGSIITGDPAVSGGQLYVGTAAGRLVAYRLPAD